MWLCGCSFFVFKRLSDLRGSFLSMDYQIKSQICNFQILCAGCGEPDRLPNRQHERAGQLPQGFPTYFHFPRCLDPVLTSLLLQEEKTRQEIVMGHSQFVVSWDVPLERIALESDSLKSVFTLSSFESSFSCFLLPEFFGNLTTIVSQKSEREKARMGFGGSSPCAQVLKHHVCARSAFGKYIHILTYICEF